MLQEGAVSHDPSACACVQSAHARVFMSVPRERECGWVLVEILCAVAAWEVGVWYWAWCALVLTTRERAIYLQSSEPGSRGLGVQPAYTMELVHLTLCSPLETVRWQGRTGSQLGRHGCFA